MMTSVSGERGIGKTYHLAKKVYQQYRSGALTITNFSHVYSNIDCSQGNAETIIGIIRELGEFKKRGFELCDLMPSFRHTAVFMAIDEAHLVFSADRFKRYQSDDKFQFIIQFLAQARKQDVNIWYSTQDPTKIDKNWRRYTDDWIRYRAVLPWKKWVFRPHPTRPTLRREIRYIIPIIWEELHNLDYENPQFNYARRSVDGISEWSPASTLVGRKMVLSGYLDSFPYKLYDSNQMIGLEYPEESNFNTLLNLSYIPHTMKRERFPTIKNLLGIKRNDSELPKRIKFENIELPKDIDPKMQDNVLMQPEEFQDHLSFFNKNVGKKHIQIKSSQKTAKAPKKPVFKNKKVTLTPHPKNDRKRKKR